MPQVAQMFGRSPPQRSHGLTLRVGEQTYRFSSSEEFAFALSGRCGVPGSRVGSLSELGDEALRREADAIRQVEQRFNDALNAALQEITRIGPFLRDMEPHLISQDHDWRAIIGALNESAEADEVYKKVAMVKYVQYLAARRQTVTTLYSARRQGRQDGNGTTDARPRDTAIFDVSELAELTGGQFCRMPKGETVEVDLAAHAGVAVLLSKYRCRIELDADSPVFIDGAERITKLNRGTNIVGRDGSCDVQINTAYRDVSRKHLIVEVQAGVVVRLTDISSHGTSISPHLLENTSI